MKKVLVFSVLLSLWLSLDGSGVWAIDVGWMQKGVRVWYFGAAGTGMSSDAEEAYLFTSIDGTNAQVTHHSAINHWVSAESSRHRDLCYSWQGGTLLDTPTDAPNPQEWRPLARPGDRHCTAGHPIRTTHL